MTRRRFRLVLLAIGSFALTLIASACSQQPENAPAPAGTSAPEVVQASYLDLTATIGEARTRVGEWLKGDEKAAPLAEERLKRADTLLTGVSWPAEMSGSIVRTKTVSAGVKIPNNAGMKFPTLR